MKRFIATLCLLTAATCHALTSGDVPDATVMYSDADPFAIGVSTAAYTLSTNLQTRVVALEGQAGCSAATTTNIVTAAIAAIPTTVRLHDITGASYFQTVEAGVGTVRVVVDGVTISGDFGGNDVIGGLWSTNYFPFSFDYGSGGVFVGAYVGGLAVITNAQDGASWTSSATAFPQTLLPANAAAHGSAVVAHGVYTNVSSRLATSASVQTVATDLDALESAALDAAGAIAAVNPYALTVYGANSVTNDTGYGAVLATNNATTRSLVTVDPTNTQSLAKYRYPVTSRQTGAYGLSCYVANGLGSGLQLHPVATLKTADGATLETAVLTGVTFPTAALTTNLVYAWTWQTSVTNGYVDVEFICDADTVNDANIRTGGAYPMALTVPIVPTAYATQGQLATLPTHDDVTNIAVAVQSSGLTYYLAGNTVSDRVSSMTNRLMTQTYTLASNAVNSITQTVPSNNFYVAAFITASNTVVQPIAPGVIQVHAHIAFTDVAVNSTAFITVELYRKNAAGADVDEFGSGEILPLVEGGAITDYTWAIPVTTRIDGTGYRYGLKFKIVNSTISGADTITLQTEGGTLSRMSVPFNNGINIPFVVGTTNQYPAATRMEGSLYFVLP